jgi:predicted Zn finger-like uncharacterized protein
MQAACQHCGAKYSLDDKKVAPHAKVQFKCAKCGKTTVLDTRAPVVAEPEAARSPEVTQAISPMPSFARTGGGGGSTMSSTIVSQYAGLSLPADKVISISVIAGAAKGLVHKMSKPRVVIGRSGCDVAVKDPEVSRNHCSIEVKGDVVRLRDLDSTNGIYIEDERVRNAELQHLSEFRIGGTTVLVQITPKHE